MKVLTLLLFFVSLGCSNMFSSDSLSLPPSPADSEPFFRDQGENNPIKGKGSSGGGSGSRVMGGGGGSSSHLTKNFCSDCNSLVTCLEGVTKSMNNLLKGWYYFCPAESDYCPGLMNWAENQLTESEYRRWLTHNRKASSSPSDRSTPFYGYVVNDCKYSGYIASIGTTYANAQTQCETDNAGNNPAIATCKTAKKKDFFVNGYQCYGEFYKHRKSFFCD